jgi:MOSC domain-containing protein YiiM
MKLLSVNVGKTEEISIGNRVSKTGIFKVPTTAPVEITLLGLAGDVIRNKKHHGGVDQAVYIYEGADYAWWSDELGKVLEPGTFGDNLTVSELESASFRIGDHLHIGEVILEVTAPRIPCATLAARMGDLAFVKRFRHAERPGLYCRVIRTGEVCAGDEVTLYPYEGETVSVLDVFHIHYDKDAGEDVLRRFLAAPIDVRSRKAFEERLEALE